MGFVITNKKTICTRTTTKNQQEHNQIKDIFMSLKKTNEKTNQNWIVLHLLP